MDTPLVSVLVTAYNRENYIAEAIESILASTFTNFELIVVDDCSVDNTVALAKNFEAIDSRVKVYVNETNLGDYPNRNKAAGYARGKYLKYVDSDDKLFPAGLEYCVKQMERFKGAEWATIYAYNIPSEFIFKSKEAIESHFFRQPFLKMGPGGTIIKKDFFLEIGMYPTFYGPANDMYFNLTAASRGDILILNNHFLFYRIHEGQEQNNHFSYLYNNYRYLRDAFDNLNLPLTKQQIKWLQLKLKRRFSVNLIRYIFRTRNIKKTKEAISKADFSAKDFIVGLFHFNHKAPKD